MLATRSSSGVANTRLMNSPIPVHLGFGHPAGRHSGGTQPDAAGDHRGILIERNRVLVDRDPGLTQRRLRDLSGQALRENVDQQ